MELRGRCSGFTVTELLIVLVIISVLAAIAIPVYLTASARAARATCFNNQMTLERATEIYLAVDPEHRRSDLEGPVNDSHIVIVNQIVGKPPRCPLGDEPADPGAPTAAEGGYVFDATGSIEGCNLGLIVKHGHYSD